jgi:glycosyltransferase involved in cell wall biosynthesis
MLYIIATHTIYNKNGDETFGPANSIADFLVRKKEKVLLIKHALEGSNLSIIILPNGEISQTEVKSKNFLSRGIREIRINFKAARQSRDKKVFIGADPINGLSGALLKIFGSTDRFIYFTVDYIEKRFENPFLNFCYHLADKLCLIFSDEVWSVSTRITKKRAKQGVKETKNKLLVNSPDFLSIKQRGYDGNQNLIIISPLSTALNLPPIITALKPLFKKYPKLKLQIVGTGDEENNFKRLVRTQKLEDRVKFLGWKHHNEVFDLISRSFLGFALYTGAASWNIYGDSMKAREYVACGLPVIINTIPSTADDVKKYNAGLVLSSVDEKEIAQFIQKCLDDRAFYLKLKQNALKMGRDFDKNVILSKLLNI